MEGWGAREAVKRQLWTGKDGGQKTVKQKQEEWTIQKTQRKITAREHHGCNEGIQQDVNGHWAECGPTTKKEVMMGNCAEFKEKHLKTEKMSPDHHAKPSQGKN